MFIKSLYLRSFRNYAEAEIHFSPRRNLILGENAQGKTNLLEAISLIATGRSFRTTRLQELIQEGAPFFFLEATVVKNGFEHTVSITFDGDSKKLSLDGNSYSTLQHLLGLLPAVFFTPVDAQLADGAPAARRKFLNMHLAQRDPLYIHHLSRYWRAMKQRNALLRLGDLSSVDCWEKEMVDSASYLWKARLQFLGQIKQPLQQHGQFLSGMRESYEIQSHFSPQDSYASLLQKNRPREKQLGMTLTGPHRDDFSLLINGKASSLFGSEGQKKSIAFGLRLAEWGLLTQAAEGPALLCIDDLGVHLDPMRKTLLNKSLESLGQVFVTAPDLVGSFEDAKRFVITAGRIM